MGSSKIGIIQFGAPKLMICPKQPELLYSQNIISNWSLDPNSRVLKLY